MDWARWFGQDILSSRQASDDPEFPKVPMSEMPYVGRNPVYIGTLIGFVLLQHGAIHAKSFGMLLAFRFSTGLFGSPVLATGSATIADRYNPSKQAYCIGVWVIAAICGPVMGPLIGGFVCRGQRLGAAYLGARVAFRAMPHLPHLLPSGNQLEQCSLSPHRPHPQGNRQFQRQMRARDRSRRY